MVEYKEIFRSSALVGLVALVVGGGWAGCARGASRGPSSGADAPPAAAAPTTGGASACVAQADCVLVQEGCCACSEGGRRIALLATRRAAYESARRCDEVMCAQAVSADPSCAPGASARCVAGRCVVEGGVEGGRPALR